MRYTGSVNSNLSFCFSMMSLFCRAFLFLMIVLGFPKQYFYFADCDAKCCSPSQIAFSISIWVELRFSVSFWNRGMLMFSNCFMPSWNTLSVTSRSVKLQMK